MRRSKPDNHKNMRFKKGRWLKVVNKLDEVQVMWLVRTKRNGTKSTKEIGTSWYLSTLGAEAYARYSEVEISTDQISTKNDSMTTPADAWYILLVLANHEENRYLM